MARPPRALPTILRRFSWSGLACLSPPPAQASFLFSLFPFASPHHHQNLFFRLSLPLSSSSRPSSCSLPLYPITLTPNRLSAPTPPSTCERRFPEPLGNPQRSLPPFPPLPTPSPPLPASVCFAHHILSVAYPSTSLRLARSFVRSSDCLLVLCIHARSPLNVPRFDPRTFRHSLDRSHLNSTH
jgi:hypothetical protein